MKKLILLFTFIPIVASASVFDCLEPLQQSETTAIVRKIETQYVAINSISSTFIQQSSFVGLNKKDFSNGLVTFQKPGLMDWQYNEPSSQRFVSDGKIIWYYQPTLKQVTITTMSNTFKSDLPVTFLLGLGKLSSSFNVIKSCRTSEGTLLTLKPKNEAEESLSSFLLLINKDNKPLGSKITDIGGNETTILLTSPKYNQVENYNFTFEIPKGTDVIDNR